jgi:hypothetical protein
MSDLRSDSGREQSMTLEMRDNAIGRETKGDSAEYP